MSNFDGKEHEEFFSKFMKATIITSVLIIILFKIHESDYLDYNLNYDFTGFIMVLSYLLIKISLF